MRQGMKAPREFSKWIQAHAAAPEALREAFLDVDGMAIHLPRPLRPLPRPSPLRGEGQGGGEGEKEIKI